MGNQRIYQPLFFSFAMVFALFVWAACQNDDLDQLFASGAIGPPGGRVRGPNGAILEIPNGSLNAVYRIELKETETDPPIGSKAVSSSVEIIPTDLSFSNTLPATLYLPLALDQIPTGQSVWAVKAYFYQNKTWQPRKAAIDDGNSTIVIPVTKAGIYAAFVSLSLPKHEPHAEPPPEPRTETSQERTPEPRTETSSERTPEPRTETSNEPIPEPTKEATITEPKPPELPPLDAGPKEHAIPPETSTSETSPSG